MGEIEIGDLIVEWDDSKDELNWKKYKIYFEDAARKAEKEEQEEYYGQYQDL